MAMMQKSGKQSTGDSPFAQGNLSCLFQPSPDCKRPIHVVEINLLGLSKLTLHTGEKFCLSWTQSVSQLPIIVPSTSNPLEITVLEPPTWDLTQSQAKEEQ
jgi:hypothetical protein